MRLHKIARLFPSMSDEEFKALVADIREHGVRQPVLVTDGQIVDGNHRWKACKKLKIDCPTVEWNGRGSLLDAVVSLNLKRRHMNKSQRAMIAARIATLRDGQHKSGAHYCAPTQTEAAALLSVGRRSVQQARKVIDSSEKELIAKVDAGKETVKRAAATVGCQKKSNDKGDRWAELAGLAAAGNTSHQIAKKLGVMPETVRAKARNLGIQIKADKIVGKAQLPNQTRILSRFAGSLQGLVPSCDMIDPTRINRATLKEALSILNESISALIKLRRKLRREITDGRKTT